MKRLLRRGYSIQTQMVLSFILLVVLTSVAVGLPSLQIIKREYERQAHAQTQQGEKVDQIILANAQNALDQLATVTAQRPTLTQLVKNGDRASLTNYLETLQTGAGVDVLTLCSPEGSLLSAAGVEQAGQFCPAAAPGIWVDSRLGYPVWMVSSLPFPDPASPLGTVVVGNAMDSRIAGQLKSQTGLEQIFFVKGRPAAASWISTPRATSKQLDSAISGDISAGSDFTLIQIGQNPYYSTRFSFGSPDFEIVTALPISDLLQAEQELTRTIVLSILGIAVVGSLLGLLVARTLSRPLARLENAAIALRMGDLSTPVPGKMRIREVKNVARALDDARIALEHTLAELRSEKEWIEHLLESIVEGIVTLDLRGRITYLSPGAERILGINQGEVLYRSCDEIFQPAGESGRFSQFIPPPGQRRKIPLRLQSGGQAILSISGARLSPPEAGKGQVALVLRDVTDEESLRRLLGDFLANITHEFRTPLSALDASVEILMEQLPDLSQAELYELLNSIHLGVISLQTLIDNLLEGASIEAGQFRVSPGPADLNQILGETAAALQPLAKKYGQEICVEAPANLPTVAADPRRTAQVIVNLLSNAIKISPQGGRIVLKAALENGSIRVQVEDEGPGIPPEYLPDLFVRFVQFESGDRVKPGAGLGLSVVKAIVEAQGGKVGAANRTGGGAEFWFTVPLHAERSLA